ncbi:hypothetical protein [Vibrio phage vB_VnaS-AQKL99]|nr:hypothetical protein [Vibrio phage vB_VnaS-AQKL99]
MPIVKIREYLSTALAVIACMAVAFGIITHLRNTNLTLSLETALATNSQLSDVNESNSKRIHDLIQQRQLDDELINKVFNQYDALKKNSKLVFDQLEHLKRNDEVLKDMLNERHPVSITGLLNARTGSHQDGDGQAKTTE